MAKKRTRVHNFTAYVTIGALLLAIVGVFISALYANTNSLTFLNRASERLEGPIYNWGNAAQFDGQTGHITIPASTVFWPQPGFTLEAWLKPVAPNIYGQSVMYGIFRYDRQIGVSEVNMGIQPQGNYYILTYNASFPTSNCITDTVYARVYATTPQDINKWQHFAAVYQDNGQVNIYLNGVAQPTYTFASFHTCSTDHDIQIGDMYSPSSVGKYNGQMEELRISNNARYQSNFVPPSRPLRTDANTLLLYNFDQPAGGKSTVIDSSGLGHDGTITGGFQFVESTLQPGPNPRTK